MILVHPGPLRARRDDAAHAVLLPTERHRGPIDGQVHVVDHRTFFDLSPPATDRAREHAGDLLDHQLDVGASTHVGEDADVFETHQRSEDLIRVDKDGGASGTLAHTTTLEHLRHCLGDLRQGATPLRSEEPLMAGPTVLLFEPSPIRGDGKSCCHREGHFGALRGSNKVRQCL